ncbi:MAG: hypothetical protein IKU55_05185 [Clostridia bacterium]|nr:hypothetical protein [Clostridia bacterium]
MSGILLFSGFLAGIGATVAVIALLLRLKIELAAEPCSIEESEIALPENKELVRLQKQLAEIDRYSGGEMGGK